MLSHFCDLRESKGRDTKLQGVNLYRGSRQSDVYLRFYDKHLESKDPSFKGVQRLELEYKKDSANLIGKSLEEGACPQ